MKRVKGKRKTIYITKWMNTNISQNAKKAANMDRTHASTRKRRADTYLRIMSLNENYVQRKKGAQQKATHVTSLA